MASYNYIQINKTTKDIIGLIITTNSIVDDPSYIEVTDLPILEDTKSYKYINSRVLVQGDKPLSITDKRQLIGNLTVTIASGKIFDGDELSQDRMVRAIMIASYTNQTTTKWKLHNNEVVTVTLEELQEALSLAGQTMSLIWLGS